MIVTTNALQRTLFIKKDDSLGTAFTVDRDDRQYIVTARHVVDGIASNDVIEIRHEQQWKQAQVELVGVGDDQVDVTILTCGALMTPTHPLEPSSSGLAHGQPVAFLGFPYGWDSGAERINNGYPMPFVKAGIVSAIIFGSTSRIYIDAHGNPGFSGGPLVFTQPGQPIRYKVAGVISDSPQDPITKDHAGFVRAISIEHVVKLIDGNPVGFPLESTRR